jgi:hypothetical protein
MSLHDDEAYAATSGTVDDDEYSWLNERRMVAEALAPKIASALSLFGSTMILYELYLDWRQGNARDRATARILVSLSVADILFSMGYFLTTWPAPSDLTYIKFNVGNQATCTFQGFINQLGFVASPLFNVTLALFFTLRIRYRWADFQLRRLDAWMQGSIWTFALCCAIYPIPLGLYNNSWQTCWIDAYPMDCLDSRYGDESDCTRGNTAWAHALAFQFLPWVSVACALVFMGMIYATVRKVEHRNTRYAGSAVSGSPGTSAESSQIMSKSFLARPARLASGIRSSMMRTTPNTSSVAEPPVASAPLAPGSSSEPSVPTPACESSAPAPSAPLHQQQGRDIPSEDRPRQNKANRQRSKQVAIQAMWYIAAFFATYLLDLVASLCYFVLDKWWFWLDIIAYFVMPLQGFFNFCVFIRTRKMKSRLGQLTRKALCCLEGKQVWSICKVMQKACLCFYQPCCKDNDKTAMSGGGDDKIADDTRANPCPALRPPPCNENIGIGHDLKTSKVSFAHPPDERSASGPRRSNKIRVDADHSLQTTSKDSFSLDLSPSIDEVSTSSMNSRKLHDQES